jgi:hypothetical protein
VLEKIYKMMCESRILYGAEIWGIEGRRWEIVDRVQVKFCKKVFIIHRNAAKGTAESQREDSKCCNEILG